MPIDFTKLSDPVWMAEAQEKRAQKEAALEEKEAKVKAALNLFSCEAAYSRLTEKEQAFIKSCEKLLRLLQPLTEKQEKWLFDLAAKERQESTVAMGMDKPAHHSDEGWESELIMLEAWQWDGRSIQDIAQRLELINIHLPNKCKEWTHTVPAECRGKVSYVASRNPVNSEDETQEQMEIIALDSSGNALVCKTRYSTYVDVEDPHFNVMPIGEAKAVREQYSQRKADDELRIHQELEEDEERYVSPRLRM